MSRAFSSEWLKLRRRGMLLAAGLIAACASLAVGLRVATVGDASGGGPHFGSSTELTEQTIAQADGLARALPFAATIVGAVVLAIFAYAVASEFSQATLRNLLVCEPRRLRLLIGKLLALVSYASAALAGALVIALPIATVAAQANGIDVSPWFSADGLAEMTAAGGRLLLAAIGWGLLGAALGLLLRSPTTAVAAGLAYALPLENLLASVWSGAEAWLPGRLLQALAEGGDSNASLAWALAVLSIYAGVALAVALAAFDRRDVTV